MMFFLICVYLFGAGVVVGVATASMADEGSYRWPPESIKEGATGLAFMLLVASVWPVVLLMAWFLDLLET